MSTRTKAAVKEDDPVFVEAVVNPHFYGTTAAGQSAKVNRGAQFNLPSANHDWVRAGYVKVLGKARKKADDYS